MSEFERFAIAKLIDKAAAAGVTVPNNVWALCSLHQTGSVGARLWAEQNPGAVPEICCDGSIDGPAECECWKPVYDVEQRPPILPTSPDDIQVRDSRCGDCAFRHDSPERADKWMEDALYAAADLGDPFWCHDGMRQPARWVHPDGRTVAGDPNDWQPPVVRGLAFRADGTTALLCSGWAARGRQTEAEIQAALQEERDVQLAAGPVPTTAEDQPRHVYDFGTHQVSLS